MARLGRRPRDPRSLDPSGPAGAGSPHGCRAIRAAGRPLLQARVSIRSSPSRGRFNSSERIQAPLFKIDQVAGRSGGQIVVEFEQPLRAAPGGGGARPARKSVHRRAGRRRWLVRGVGRPRRSSAARGFPRLAPARIELASRAPWRSLDRGVIEGHGLVESPFRAQPFGERDLSQGAKSGHLASQALGGLGFIEGS